MKIPRMSSLGRFFAAAAGLVLLAGSSAFAQRLDKPEHYTATILAEGDYVAYARFLRVDVTIWQYSTPQDQQSLVQAFERGGQQGLVNALSRMSAKGHVDIPGTLGYDLSYVKVFQTPNGRRIRAVTNRSIRFGEAWTDSRSMSYDLGMFELDFGNNKGKGGGEVIFAGQFIVSKGQLTVESYGAGPFKVIQIDTWK
ncbi:MAG: hypothetical protein KGL59_14725 [Acidobacteriota bacterium]|nr:hypothetical protein [Acidobacteriota bacterium]